MSGIPIRVLLVEDDADDVLLTRALLRELDAPGFELDWARNREEVAAQLDAGAHDVYLVDYRLGRDNGLDIARDILTRDPHKAVIMLTGQADHEVDVQAAEIGIADYLVKGRLDAAMLERSIRYSITSQRALHALAESEERYALALAGANDGLWDWDLRSDRLYVSARWKSMLGYAATEVGDSPQEWFERVHPADAVQLQHAIRAHLHGRAEHFEFEHRMRAKDGRYRWVLARGLAVAGIDDKPTRFAGSLTDVTERKRAERQLQHDALHDALTGLPNRVLFVDRLEHALRRGARAREEGRVAVLFLDLDRFKLVNDSLGHLVGDRLLVSVARRLESALRPGDTVARLGGDEFTVLLEDLPDQAEAELVADRILECFAASFTVEERDLYLSASIGIAVPGRAATADEVIRDADTAMYRAKADGKGRHAMFDAALHEEAIARLDLETRLRRGLTGTPEEAALEVVFQPIVAGQTRRVAGFEALARWRDSGERIDPEMFIPIAEETGLIHVLGERVLDSACAQLARWRADGVGDQLTVAVNISRLQLLEPGFCEHVRGALERHKLPADSLRLEITETAASAEPEIVRQALEEIYESVGVRAHLDDFGTGASSLTFLRGFPGDALKIDRSFVLAMADDAGAFQIVKAIIGLAHNLGMTVVAEGVEGEDLLEMLVELGCEYAQGFYFARPLSVEDATAFLREHAHSH